MVQQGRCAHKAGLARSEGRSSTAAAAYRAGVCITDERTGEVFDYTRKGGVEHSEIIVPEKAHADLQRMAYMSRSADLNERGEGQAAFWNANEKAHKRGDATVAREIETDLPWELSADDRKQLALEFGAELAERYGVGVQVSIHEPRTVTDRDLEQNPGQFHVTDPETGRRHNGNWHVHYLLTTKELNEQGFGNKARALDPTAARFDGTEQAANWTRPRWESKVQDKLNERGIDKLYTTRSKDDTRALLIERGQYELAAQVGEPTKHMGHAAAALERKGEQTQVGDLNRAIREGNARHAERADLATSVLDRLTDQQSTFTDRDLYREICKQSDERLGDQLHETVAQCIGRDDVVLLGTDDRGNVRMTTRQMQDMERRMVDQSTARRGEGQHPVDSARLDHHAKKNGLSDEQAAALHHMSGKDGVSLVEGMAGTGKSTMMKAASEAWQEAGYQVRGAALAGKAADGLQQSAGIKSQTVHSLLMALDNGRDKLNSKTILCIDEAGMLSSNLTSRLVEHAGKAGAKLVMIGDDRQLQPIQAGGAFKALKDELGAAKLSTIYRQRDEWARDAVHSFADGDAGKAISAYAQRGLVGVGTDADDTKKRLVGDWNSQRTDDGRSSIMLAGTRKDVRDLNELARGERVKAGEIEQGERVRTDQGEREFAKGDRLVFLKNDKRVGVKNGQLGTVENVERDGEHHRLSVRGDGGKLATFSTRDYDRLDHGYATTVHKAQGVTVDRAYVLTGKMHDRELSYVSMSRSRQETRLYIDAGKYKSAAAVARQMNQSHQKGTTLDAARERPDWTQLQGLAASSGNPSHDATKQPAQQAQERAQQPELTKDELLARIRAKAGESQQQEARPEPQQATAAPKPEQAAQPEREQPPVPRMTREEIDRALRAPQPTLQDRESVEASAIGNHLRDLRQELEAGHLAQHGERPTRGLLVGTRQKSWDRAHAEIGTAVEAKREFLWSDDPRAVEFRESAWTKAREDFDAKYEKWQGNYLAAIQQQAGPQLQPQPQPQEQSTMSNNQQQTQQQTLNRENERRKAQQEQLRRLQEARRQQQAEQEQKRQQERSRNNSFGQEM